MYPELNLYIDGQWQPGTASSGQDVVNPATGHVLAHLGHASTVDLDAALDAAMRGFALWRRKTAVERSDILRAAAALVRERRERIATVLTSEQGKVLAEALIEVQAAADSIDWMAEEGRRAYGRIIPGRAGVRQMVIAEPVGVVAAFSPWNFPIVIPARKIAAALAAGCSIIIKPAEETPGTAVELVRCFEDAGLPKGVLNLVFGIPADISTHLIAADQVRKISFTGSVAVGKHLAGLAAHGVKRMTMELGGHAPVIVCADADPEKSAQAIAAFKYRNAGQVCISPTRFLVHQSIHGRFVDRFVAFAENLKLGNGLVGDTTMGPLANDRRPSAMEAFIADAEKRGGRIRTGGRRRGNEGVFFEPTVITDVPDDSKIMSEEPFGPIAPIVAFSDLGEAITRANALPFGLAAYAFTTSSDTAHQLADGIEAGMIGINSTAISNAETPFGGVKESGYGQECGVEGLQAYLVNKFVSHAS